MHVSDIEKKPEHASMTASATNNQLMGMSFVIGALATAHLQQANFFQNRNSPFGALFQTLLPENAYVYWALRMPAPLAKRASK
jgi:hypothetical protein